MYSLGVSEEVTGRAIQDFSRRDDVVIATKVFNAMGNGPNDKGLSRKHIMRSIDGSLRRLGTDYVDLYQIHRWDTETPIEETLEALNDIVRAGKARYIGASTHGGLAVRQGPAHVESARVDAVRLDAESLQSGLPRGRAGDAAALPG